MSIINKMLSDLDKKEPQTQVKEEVAFLESKPEPQKPQRSKKWWAALISSGVSGVLAVVVGYLYYSQLVHTNDVLDNLQAGQQPPANQNLEKSTDNQTITNTEAQVVAQKVVTEEPANDGYSVQDSVQDSVKNEASAEVVQNKADSPSNQPKLVVLNNKDENGQPVARQSTLSVQQQATKPPVISRSKEKPLQLAQQNDEEPIVQQSNGPITNNNDAQKHLADATLNEQVNSTQGQMTISKVLMSNEQRAKKHAIEGQKLAQEGMIQPAIEKYQQAINVYPAHQEGRLALAGLYYGRNMVAEALEVLSAGLNIDPGNQSWSLLAAKIHYSRDNFAAALAYLQLPVHPVDNIEYVALKATTLQKLKDYQGAAQVFGQLTVAYPDSARWWLGFATSLEGVKKYTQAIDAYRQTLRLGSISQTSRRFVLSRLAQLER